MVTILILPISLYNSLFFCHDDLANFSGHDDLANFSEKIWHAKSLTQADLWPWKRTSFHSVGSGLIPLKLKKPIGLVQVQD